MTGPKAPKDPTKKRKGFYIMRGKSVTGSEQPDGRGTQFLYMNDGRMLSSARIVGNVTDEEILKLMETTEGFRKLVHSIGVTVESDDREEVVDYAFQMYGKTDIYGSGTVLRMPVTANGMEHMLNLEDCEWSEDDDIPGQMRFEFEKPNHFATVAVKFYLHDGYDVPDAEEEEPVDLTSSDYQEMLKKSLVQTGNNVRLKKAIDKAKKGEDITIAFIGGSITQGAGAIPIHTECYAYKTFKGLCELVGKGTDENIHYVKAGIGGTSSELGMLRYERDVLDNGNITPDIVIVEFAVNDEGDETQGESYDSLVRKIYNAENEPAVILMFSVFAYDWNLQDRLSPVGECYQLPMVSVKDAVVEQFYKKSGEGKVLSKNQFFYDSFHPSNMGHTIMADGLIHLLKVVDAQAIHEEIVVLDNIQAPIGGEFEKVKLLDRSQNEVGAVIDCGSFSHTDEDLQVVERNMDLTTTKTFPYNWMYNGEDGADYKPFVMDITCSALLMISKDSGANQVGCAEVYVDGEKVLLADPHVNGWTHNNAQICFRGREKKNYHVEVRMQPGQEEKEFTILGFGYVD